MRTMRDRVVGDRTLGAMAMGLLVLVAPAVGTGPPEFFGRTAVSITPNFFPSLEWTLLESGLVLFEAFEQPSGNNGLYLNAGAGGATPLMRSGEDAPFLDGDETWLGPTVWEGTDGGYAFQVGLLGTGVDSGNNVALYAGSLAAGLRLVFREGDEVPGLPGRTFSFGATWVRANAGGQVLFHCDFDNGSGGLFIDVGFGPVLIEEVSAASVESPALTAHGNASLVGFLDGEWSVWSGSPTSLVKVVSELDSAPGTSGVFLEFDELAVSVPERLALKADLSGARQGIFSSIGGGGRLVHESTRTVGRVTTNWSGQVAFLEAIGLPEVAVYAEVPGLTLIAQGGEQVPGLASGVEWFDFRGPIINAFQQVVFQATLSGPGVGSANDQSLWLYQPGQALQMLVRDGGTIQIAPGDIRTLQSFETEEPHSLQDGRSKNFNARGEVAIEATFTDGSAALVVLQALSPNYVFADGLESGDTSGWSSVVGLP